MRRRDTDPPLVWASKHRALIRRFARPLRGTSFPPGRRSPSRRGRTRVGTDRTPHDASYRAFFSNPEMVESLLRDFGPPEIVADLDFSTLERVPGDFVVPRSLRRRQSDCMWRLRCKCGDGDPSGTWCYVLLILEFQSRPDEWMSIRLLAYTALALLDICKTLKKGELVPLPLAFVVFNGKEKWPVLLDVADLFRHAPEAFRAYLPKQRLCFLDMRRAPVEHRHGYTAQLARLERSESPEEVFDVLKELEQHLPEGSPLKESFSAWADILLRLMDASLSPDVIGKNLSMMQVNNMYTDYTEILERWRTNAQQQGIQIGEARGEARGELKMLVSLVADGLLPLSAAAKKAGMTEDEFSARMLDHETTRH